MSSFNKKYTNENITVFWAHDKCIHSGNCVRGLHPVFDPQRRPWIIMENGATEDIVRTVQRCPSGALTFEYHNKD